MTYKTAWHMRLPISRSAALDFTGNPILPRGELFLDRDFLDHFCGARGRLLWHRSPPPPAPGALAGRRRPQRVRLPRGQNQAGLKTISSWGASTDPSPVSIESAGFFKAMASVHRDRGLFTEAAGLFVEEVERAAGIACARGFQALAITDDIAGKGGLFFSPDYFARPVWPVYRQAARIAKEMGLRAFFHSDGDTRKVIELLIKAGYDCIHPVDAQAGLDVDDLRKEFGPAVCFMGHIDIMGWGEERIRRRSTVRKRHSGEAGLYSAPVAAYRWRPWVGGSVRSIRAGRSGEKR